LMYEYGWDGVPQDYREAFKWLKKAAEHGYADAQFSLGCMHSQGQGMAADYREASEWYWKAAEQGHELARRQLESKPAP
ncbi:sel1 repeat family protein, partial [bacterium]|nr:sel1 repeat family protein [bacterium]